MSKKAFTLVEVLVSIVIIGFISAAAFMSYSTSHRANTRTQNRTMALNLLQKSIEEVRSGVHSRNLFDTLASCTGFDDPLCNFEDIHAPGPAQYPADFNRSFTVTNAPGPVELKIVDINVGYTDIEGKPQQLNSTIYLSRPPQALPGNIKGIVTDANTGAVIKGVDIDIAYVLRPTLTYATISDDDPDGDIENYTFADVSSGNFVLEPGNWVLTASHEDYRDYTHPTPITVRPNTPEDVDFSMIPKPRDGKIPVRVINSQPPNQIVGPLYFSLYKEGNCAQGCTSSGTYRDMIYASSYTFNIPFEDDDQQCFTIATGWGMSSWGGYFPYRFKYCGDGPPSCSPFGANYDYRGWSSAVIPPIGCGNPWRGAAVIDGICVNPGQTRATVDIPLAPVPTATVHGYVYDGDGNTVSGAHIYVNWHNSRTSSTWLWATVVTDASGYYTTSVPAEQELFPDKSAYHLWMTARADIPTTICCDVSGAVQLEDFTQIPSVYAGQTKNHDFHLPAASIFNCGDAKGFVWDGKASRPLTGVIVNIASKTNSTVDGNFEIQCPEGPPPYSIPVGNHTVVATKGLYYTFRSDGNEYYSSTVPGAITTSKDTITTYGDIRLWPMGKGDIIGRIIDSSTSNGINGVTVRLRTYSGVTYTRTTNTSGNFTFANISESWPPPMIDNPGYLYYNYYNHTPRTHNIVEISHPNYISPDPLPAKCDNIVVEAGITTNLGDIAIAPNGGF